MRNGVVVMAGWLRGRTVGGAWLRNLLVALLPLILTTLGFLVYRALTLPERSLVSYVDPSLAEAEDHSLIWLAFGGAALCTVLGLILSVWHFRSLVEPAIRLEEAARSRSSSLGDQDGSPVNQVAAASHLVGRLAGRISHLEQERFFLAANVPFAIIGFDSFVIEVNDAWLRLIEYPREAYDDRPSYFTIHPEEQLQVVEAYEMIRQGIPVAKTVWRHLTASGREIWVDWSATPDMERRLFYTVGRDVTMERQQALQAERQAQLYEAVARLWLIAKSHDTIDPLLREAMAQLTTLFPMAQFAIWEETAAGGWHLRAGDPSVLPEHDPCSYEIPGELVRFGLLVARRPADQSKSTDGATFCSSLVEIIGAAVKAEREWLRQTIQAEANQILAEGQGINEAAGRLLPAICQPLGWIAGRVWLLEEEPVCLAQWVAPETPAYVVESYPYHDWIVRQTLKDGQLRWIPEGSQLPSRPDKVAPTGRFTFPITLGTTVIGLFDCLVPVMRTPDAGFLTLLSSLGAQCGLFIERRRAEEERRQQALLLRGRSELMALAAAGAPIEDVLKEICHVAEALLPGCYAQAGILGGRMDRWVTGYFSSHPTAIQQGFNDEAKPFDCHHESFLTERLYSANKQELVANLPNYAGPMVEGFQSGWYWPILIGEGAGILVMGYFSPEEGQLRGRAEQVLEEVAHLAQMALERWRLEQALTQRIALLLEHMQEGLVAVDSRLRLLELNPAARRLLGLSHNLPIGSSAIEELPEGLASALELMLNHEDEPQSITLKVDGQTIYAYLSPVSDQDGVRYGAIALLEDSTGQQRFKQLQTSLVANVSHDLKAPLAALSTLVEVVVDGLVSPEVQQQYLIKMKEEIGRLRRLTTDLLLLARLDAGLVTLQPEVVQIRDLLEGLAETWTPRCSAAGLRLTVEGAELTVWADYDRVMQVLTNLLENAVKFTPEGGQITLRLKPLTDGMVEIAVADTGPGIAPEHLQQVWNRFYMADQARSRAPETGTGLGLAIARPLIEAMGGQVGVESTVGVGTTFWIRLPGATQVSPTGRGRLTDGLTGPELPD
jgi:PAS domain S-box-containing protein